MTISLAIIATTVGIFVLMVLFIIIVSARQVDRDEREQDGSP